jgi:hypothetical protein
LANCDHQRSSLTQRVCGCKQSCSIATTNQTFSRMRPPVRISSAPPTRHCEAAVTMGKINVGLVISRAASSPESSASSSMACRRAPTSALRGQRESFLRSRIARRYIALPDKDVGFIPICPTPRRTGRLCRPVLSSPLRRDPICPRPCLQLG